MLCKLFLALQIRTCLSLAFQSVYKNTNLRIRNSGLIQSVFLYNAYSGNDDGNDYDTRRSYNPANDCSV
jgi:hypothetical protein